MADLRHLGRDAGRRRIAELLERFDLFDAAGKPLATYSGGMKRRLDLAMTLVGDPRLIFLDEPTSGLDPRSRRTVWQIIRELVADGVTILLTTQYLDEAYRFADQVAILDNGRIVAEGTPTELKRRLPGGHVQLQLRRATLSGVGRRQVLPNASPDIEHLNLQAPGDSRVASLREVLGPSDDAGIEAEHLLIDAADLDDVFLAVTGPTPPSTRPAMTRRRSSHESPRLHRHRLGHHAPPQAQAPAALPVDYPDAPRLPVVFLLLFVYVFGGQLGSGLAGERRPTLTAVPTSPTSFPASCSSPSPPPPTAARSWPRPT